MQFFEARTAGPCAPLRPPLAVVAVYPIPQCVLESDDPPSLPLIFADMLHQLEESALRESPPVVSSGIVSPLDVKRTPFAGCSWVTLMGASLWRMRISPPSAVKITSQARCCCRRPTYVVHHNTLVPRSGAQYARLSTKEVHTISGAPRDRYSQYPSTATRVSTVVLQFGRPSQGSASCADADLYVQRVRVDQRHGLMQRDDGLALDALTHERGGCDTVVSSMERSEGSTYRSRVCEPSSSQAARSSVRVEMRTR